MVNVDYVKNKLKIQMLSQVQKNGMKNNSIIVMIQLLVLTIVKFVVLMLIMNKLVMSVKKDFSCYNMMTVLKNVFKIVQNHYMDIKVHIQNVPQHVQNHISQMKKIDYVKDVAQTLMIIKLKLIELKNKKNIIIIMNQVKDNMVKLIQFIMHIIMILNMFNHQLTQLIILIVEIMHQGNIQQIAVVIIQKICFI